MDHADSAVLCRIFITDTPALIGRAVIYQQDLNIPQCLRDTALGALAQILLRHLVDRYDNTDGRHIRGLIYIYMIYMLFC